LEVTLLSGDRKRIESRETENVGAHVAYLKGRTLLHDRTERAVRDAQKQFEIAINHDPNYAQAYAGLADVYHILWDWSYAPRAECEEKSKALVETALELDPDLPEAHLSLASLLHDNYQFAEAAKEFQRAIALIPSNATAHHWYSMCLFDLGKQREALSEILRAEELDPLSLNINSQVLWQYLDLGEEEEALKTLQRIKEIDDPEGQFTLMATASYYEYKSDYDQALMTRNKLKELWPNSRFALSYDADIAWLYAKMNRRQAAVEVLNKMLRDFNQGASTAGSDASSIGLVYGELNDLDEAFKWFEKAVDARPPQLLGTLRFSPFCEKERRDPRFGALLKRAGLDVQPVS
jgi:tetratricopeptide (TPR) repeat protein